MGRVREQQVAAATSDAVGGYYSTEVLVEEYGKEVEERREGGRKGWF
jgi:hypothetical protein